MTTSLTVKILLILVVAGGIILYKYFTGQKSSLKVTENTTQTPPDFYSINDGNQTELFFAPAYNKQWFDELDKKYSWDNFEAYDNRFWEYMYNIFDTLPALAKGQTKSARDFFNKLTRGQKVFYSVLVFGGDTDNGGVYQFFFNRPEFCFAALEAFKELKLDTLAKDYEKCLNEFIGTADSYGKRKEIFNDPKFSWEEKAKSFQDGYSDVKSAKVLEDYFYTDDFKKVYYKTVVDYIDNNLDQFVKK
ncbi:DMP19 family protein [Flavihumibacter rivuli]|uniref:DMP19 family protein n=1 Tax=Flavihumibacter rivuli TaxID=2838156 RepID=UPI001BDF190D|nr:DUF4375 domain-containing protein [Flavihumibacter rivuli]ULQ57140.1 DMP19 family protein [Flavihumibacter rivuli]